MIIRVVASTSFDERFANQRSFCMTCPRGKHQDTRYRGEAVCPTNQACRHPSFDYSNYRNSSSRTSRITFKPRLLRRKAFCLSSRSNLRTPRFPSAPYQSRIPIQRSPPRPCNPSRLSPTAVPPALLLRASTCAVPQLRHGVGPQTLLPPRETYFRKGERLAAPSPSQRGTTRFRSRETSST